MFTAVVAVLPSRRTVRSMVPPMPTLSSAFVRSNGVRTGTPLAAVMTSPCVPVSAFGPGWPEGVPVQIHGMDADPIFVGEGDIDAARELVDQAQDADLFLYPGDQHYFADSSLPSYDPDATALLTQRVLDFLHPR